MYSNSIKKNPKSILGYLMALAMVLFTYSVSAQVNHDVTIVGNTFSPATLTIDVGDQVTFTNDAATGGGGFHNVNGTQATYPGNPDNSLDNGAPVSGTWNYVWTCTVAGTYDYVCDPHASLSPPMVGSITANAVSSGSSSLISACSDFVAGPNATWTHVLVATTVADGSVSQGAQTYNMNVTSLPTGGANFRVFKSTANGGDFFGNAIALTLGSNTITVGPGECTVLGCKDVLAVKYN
jgi:plastocyanin